MGNRLPRSRRAFLSARSTRVLELNSDGPRIYHCGNDEYVEESGHESPGLPAKRWRGFSRTDLMRVRSNWKPARLGSAANDFGFARRVQAHLHNRLHNRLHNLLVCSAKTTSFALVFSNEQTARPLHWVFRNRPMAEGEK